MPGARTCLLQRQVVELVEEQAVQQAVNCGIEWRKVWIKVAELYEEQGHVYALWMRHRAGRVRDVQE